MRKAIYFSILFFFPNLAFNQVTFVVENLTGDEIDKANIFISGDFEGWTGGQDEYKLKFDGVHHQITLPKTTDHIQYKFTKGSWKSVESNIQGTSIENRTYRFSNTHDTIRITIEYWTETQLLISSATQNVYILDKAFYIPQLGRDRRIWVYLPPTYEQTNKRYPVLYLQDGQNMFEDTTAFAGEWKIDETLNKLSAEDGLNLIVVAVDNGNKRLNEYNPWNNERFGLGEGEAYVDFLITDLKPMIDSKLRTKPEKENTGILGSSMGGLISYYGGLKYSDVYGKIGVFSPSFWINDEVFTYTEDIKKLKSTKIYFLAGDNESEEMVNNMNRIVKILSKKLKRTSEIESKIVQGGQHNEMLWSNEFAEAVLWLFQ